MTPGAPVRLPAAFLARLPTLMLNCPGVKPNHDAAANGAASVENITVGRYRR